MHTIDTARPPGPNNTRAALCEAIDDEFHARATYLRVIERFGPVQPFVNILASEERHIAALCGLFERFGWDVPADRWAAVTEAPTSLEQACRSGAEAEIANAALYRRVMTMTDDPDVLRVFDNLRRASQERHLPAFQRCAERGGTSGGCGSDHDHDHGHGRGRRGCRSRGARA